ncbi:MAG: TolC family protein [Phycisphaeraceae bacterium]|nr:TolC family protein [Phycisphaeraceae bacterium]
MTRPTSVPRPPRRRSPASLLAAASLFAAGCSNPFGPADSDYGLRLPEQRYRNIERLKIEDYARPTSLPEQPEDVIARRFDKNRFAGLEKVDISLEQARASAVENNLEIKVVLVDPRLAGQTLRAEEAKFEAVFKPFVTYRDRNDPTLDVTTINEETSTSYGAAVDVPLRSGGRASVSIEENSTDSSNPFLTLSKSYQANTLFSISQPLLRNAGRQTATYSIRIASYDDQITQARTKLEIIRQLAAVDRSYWRLYAARQQLDVTQQQYELASAQLDRVKRRFDAGATPEVEVLRSQSGLAERLGSIIIAENNVLTQQRETKRIINMPGLPIESATVIVPATLPEPIHYQFDPVSLCESAIGTRMEMLELELQLARDATTIDFTQNQALPLFTLDFTYRIPGLGASFSAANSQMTSVDFQSWTVGLAGEIPIGNEAAKARVDRAILARLQRLSTRESREQAIRQEVLNAIDQVNANWQRILAARQATLAATRTFEAEQRQNDVGLRTSTDVLDAATRLAEAQFSEISAITDYQIGLVDLAFATGTLLGKARVDWLSGPPTPAEQAIADPPAPRGDAGLFPVNTIAPELPAFQPPATPPEPTPSPGPAPAADAPAPPAAPTP